MALFSPVSDYLGLKKEINRLLYEKKSHGSVFVKNQFSGYDLSDPTGIAGVLAETSKICSSFEALKKDK